MLALQLGAEDSGSGIVSVLPLVLIVAAFYFVLIRPQRNRMRAMRATQSTLEPGREVMTTAGLFGRVTAVEDATFRMEIAPGVEIKLARVAVAQIVDELPESLGGTGDDAKAE